MSQFINVDVDISITFINGTHNFWDNVGWSVLAMVCAGGAILWIVFVMSGSTSNVVHYKMVYVVT